MSDVRLAIRLLCRSSGFALSVIALLALGVGAVAGMYVLVLGSGLRLVGAGLVLGLGATLLLGRVLGSTVLAEVGRIDLGLIGAVAIVLGSAGFLASILPAFRALRIPPAIALRQQ